MAAIPEPYLLEAQVVAIRTLFFVLILSCAYSNAEPTVTLQVPSAPHFIFETNCPELGYESDGKAVVAPLLEMFIAPQLEQRFAGKYADGQIIRVKITTSGPNRAEDLAGVWTFEIEGLKIGEFWVPECHSGGAGQAPWAYQVSKGTYQTLSFLAANFIPGENFGKFHDLRTRILKGALATNWEGSQDKLILRMTKLVTELRQLEGVSDCSQHLADNIQLTAIQDRLITTFFTLL